MTTVKEFITGFVKGTLGKKTRLGTWTVVKQDDVELLQYSPSDKPDVTELVAYKMLDGSVLSNANQLEYVGRRIAWGYECSKYGNQEPEQQWLEDAGAIPLPFTLFEEAHEDMRNFKWIVTPVPETVTILMPPNSYGGTPRRTTRHFSGACIFNIGNNTYLFDIDRQELEHQIFNPFLTKLPKLAGSIEEAYDILMPDEVKSAMSAGTEVLRQGEFFFIRWSDDCPVNLSLTDEEREILKFPPSRIGFGATDNLSARRFSGDSDPFPEKKDLNTLEKREFQEAALRYAQVFEKYLNIVGIPGTLGKSATGSHSVTQYIKDGDIVYVSGTVKQNRRQHEDLVLSGWYKVVANNGTISWTITGDID